jgi:tetratricopeptide (TPR) repeat protein
MLIGASCSQEKNTIVNRFYHNTTARYNGFFNGRLALQEAHKSMRASYQEDYTSLLPIFIYAKTEVVQPVYPQLDRAIEKTSLVVDRHSMDISGKENCKWIDDTWIVMGEAQFLKGEYTQAKQIFDFTKRRYDDPVIRQLSYLWLGRVYLEQEQYDRAGDHFRKVSMEDGLPEKNYGEFKAVMADYYQRQGRMEKAIEQLEEAVNYTRDRAEKTRRMFILAQWYDQTGDGSQSSQLFAEVIRRNPTYEMAFYAKINRALAHDVTAGNTAEIKEILFKMIKDEKNAEYLDQIYYALAELELKEKNEAKGIEYLHLATRKSVRNGNAKGLAYYRLADIYFAKPKYEQAQVYYDSTVAFLSPEHPDYPAILSLSKSLTQMMRDIRIIEGEDSLQEFALLPRDEQERRINQRIQDQEQKEKDAEREKQIQELQSQQSKFNQNAQFNQSMKSGDWYFYNPGAVGFGVGEFKKIWGANRKNEDNWRRADKTSAAPLLVAEEGVTLEEDTIEGADDPKNPNYYWKSVPDSDEKMKRSHALIIEALYDLALVYKDQMNDMPPSAETFEELLSRYDSSKYHPVSHYQLYLMYQQMGNAAKSDYHKEQILSRYPSSDYAKVIINPTYAIQEKQTAAEAERAYQEAYAYFDQGYYRQAYDLVAHALQAYPNSPYEPQLRFLEALCLGYVDSEAHMISALKDVKAKYGTTDVGKEASDIILYFENGRSFEQEIAEAQNEIASEMVEKAKANYNYDIGASHNFVLVIPDSANVQATQTKVSDFNRKYFSTKGFKTSSIPLKDGKTMIIVSNVGYASKAMDYYGTFTGAPEVKDLQTSTRIPFVISYDNYAEFYKDPNTDAYAQFFTENYLKDL